MATRMRTTGLPEGLECVPNAITGAPRYAGTYAATIEFLVGQRVEATEACPLVISEQECLFFEDFEADPGAWTWGGLWRRIGPTDGSSVRKYQFAEWPQSPWEITAIWPFAPDHVAYHGNHTTNTYDTGDRTIGTLELLETSQGIDLMGAQYVTLAFASCRRVEEARDGYDWTQVQVRFDTGCSGWCTVWNKDSGDKDTAGWQDERANDGAPLAVPAGATRIWVRFSCDSIEPLYNGYFG